MTDILASVVAVIVTYIAWQQWRTTALRLRLDLYDRRMEVFRATTELLARIVRDGDVSYEDLFAFRRTTSAAEFLFRKDIPEYLEKLYGCGLELKKSNDQARGRVADDAPARVYRELTYLTAQFDEARSKFRRYLDLSNA